MMLFLDGIAKFFTNSLVCLLLLNIIASYVEAYYDLNNEDNEEEDDDYKNNHWKNKY